MYIKFINQGEAIVNKNKMLISNDVLQDERLSIEALGMLMFLYSNSNEKKMFSVDELVASSSDDELTVRHIIKELEKYDYVQTIFG